jgi:hypothetical protein
MTEIKKQTVGYLEDNQGNPSSIRLNSLIALMASCIFGVLTILHSQDVYGVYITMGFLLAAFAPKALQKFAEAKFNL